MKTIKLRIALFLGAVSVGAVMHPALAAGVSSAEDAYYTKMQQDLLGQSRANSTAAKEALIRQNARSSAECADLKQVSADTGKRYAQAHIAPDPTKVIENNTCFMDVQSVQIPSTGFGFADQLLKNFLGSTFRRCSNSSSSWTGVVNAVSSGNWKSATNLSAIQGYVGQTQNLAPIGNVLISSPAVQSGALQSNPTGLYVSPTSQPYSGTPAQQSVAERLWAKLTGSGQ